jgi:Mor transcription activator family
MTTEIQLDLFDLTTTPLGAAARAASTDLPRVAQEIHGLVGDESLVRFINRWGGVHLDFPRHAENFATSKVVLDIADEIGIADATKIAAHFQGVRLHVPRCTAAVIAIRNRSIREKLDKGMPAHEIARLYKMTERHVWRIAKQL